MIIPGSVISAVTFPGVMLHERAHKKYCEWLGVKVHKVVYFQFGNPAGYVQHSEPKNYQQCVWIPLGPMIINSLATLACGFLLVVFPMDSFFYILSSYLGISFGINAIPSNTDADSMIESVKNLRSNGEITSHVGVSIVYRLIKIANWLSFFWFDIIYAILLLYIGSGGNLA